MNISRLSKIVARSDKKNAMEKGSSSNKVLLKQKLYMQIGFVELNAIKKEQWFPKIVEKELTKLCSKILLTIFNSVEFFYEITLVFMFVNDLEINCGKIGQTPKDLNPIFMVFPNLLSISQRYFKNKHKFWWVLFSVSQIGKVP